MDEYKYYYHQPPNVPPDWLNEDVDRVLRMVLDEVKNTGSSTVEVDVDDPFIEECLRELEFLGYLAIEDDEGFEKRVLATPREIGRSYYRRRGRDLKELQSERDERRARIEHEERVADADRRARVSTALIAAIGAVGASAVSAIAGGDAASRALAAAVAVAFVVAAIAVAAGWSRVGRGSAGRNHEEGAA